MHMYLPITDAQILPGSLNILTPWSYVCRCYCPINSTPLPHIILLTCFHHFIITFLSTTFSQDHRIAAFFFWYSKFHEGVVHICWAAIKLGSPTAQTLGYNVYILIILSHVVPVHGSKIVEKTTKAGIKYMSCFWKGALTWGVKAISWVSKSFV